MKHVGRKAGLKDQVLEVITTYRFLFDESGLPGLRFVLGFHVPLRRLAWLMVYAVLFLLTMRDTHRLLAEYYAYDDRVNQEILEVRCTAGLPIKINSNVMQNKGVPPRRWTVCVDHCRKSITLHSSLGKCLVCTLCICIKCMRRFICLLKKKN